MSETGNEVNPRRTAAWLELKDAGMSQKKIGRLLGISQSTVNRAFHIAEGLRDGPYTDDMNEAIDGYIVRRDEHKAKLKQEQQEKAERDAAEKARREKAEARERLRAWVDDELTLSEQDEILRRYRQDRSSGKPITPDEALDVLVRHLKGLDEPPAPQVQKERAPVGQRKSVVVRPAAGPVATASGATPIRDGRPAEVRRETTEQKLEPSVPVARSPARSNEQPKKPLLSYAPVAGWVALAVIIAVGLFTGFLEWSISMVGTWYVSWGSVVVGVAYAALMLVPASGDKLRPSSQEGHYLILGAVVFISAIVFGIWLHQFQNPDFADHYTVP